MAQDGDTITYTFSGGSSVSENVSDVDEIEIIYIDGAGGNSDNESGGAGGRVENVVADIPDFNTLYLWVGSSDEVGRYFGQRSTAGNGGGSTEVSVSPDGNGNRSDAPFIAAAGAGGGGGGQSFGTPIDGGVGARNNDSDDNFGDPPPDGGSPAGDGKGAVDGHGSNITIIDSGTTTKGGGSGSDTNGEIQISYKQTLSPPDPPSNLSAEVQ